MGNGGFATPRGEPCQQIAYAETAVSYAIILQETSLQAS